MMRSFLVKRKMAKRNQKDRKKSSKAKRTYQFKIKYFDYYFSFSATWAARSRCYDSRRSSPYHSER